MLAEPPLSLFILPRTKLLLLTIAIGCEVVAPTSLLFLIIFLSFSIYSLASIAFSSLPLLVFEAAMTFFLISPPPLPPFLTVVFALTSSFIASCMFVNTYPVAAEGENVPEAISLNIPSRINGRPPLLEVFNAMDLGSLTVLPSPGKLYSDRFGSASIIFESRILYFEWSMLPISKAVDLIFGLWDKSSY